MTYYHLFSVNKTVRYIEYYRTTQISLAFILHFFERKKKDSRERERERERKREGESKRGIEMGMSVKV